MSRKKERFERYISNKFSWNDYLYISSSFEEEKSSFKKLMEQDWEETKSSNTTNPKFKLLLKKLHSQISPDHRNRQRDYIQFINFFSKIASVLILPALITIAFLYYQNNKQIDQLGSWAEIHSPAGARTKFQLPDGTTGWLNSGSSIKYPIQFVQNRGVQLIGEAYFDVAHSKNSKFTVNTKYILVEVLGTKFNVSAFPEDKKVEVALEQGQIKLKNKRLKIEETLKPNEKFTYYREKKKGKIKAIEASDYTCWKDGYLKFRSEKLSNVLKKMERWYNVEFVVSDKQLLEYRYRATFHDESIDEILRLISLTTPIKYQIQTRNANDKNIYTKRKIIIDKQ